MMDLRTIYPRKKLKIVNRERDIAFMHGLEVEGFILARTRCTISN